MEDKQFLDKMVASIHTVVCGLDLNQVFFDVSMSSLSSQGNCFLFFHIRNSLEHSAYFLCHDFELPKCLLFDFTV